MDLLGQLEAERDAGTAMEMPWELPAETPSKDREQGRAARGVDAIQKRGGSGHYSSSLYLWHRPPVPPELLCLWRHRQCLHCAGLPVPRPPKQSSLGAPSEFPGPPTPRLQEPFLGSMPHIAVNTLGMILHAADYTAQPLPRMSTYSFGAQAKAGSQAAWDAKVPLRSCAPKPGSAGEGLQAPGNGEHHIMTEPGLKKPKGRRGSQRPRGWGAAERSGAAKHQKLPRNTPKQMPSYFA